MRKVVINGEVFFAENEEILSDILMKNKKIIPHQCGGKGFCKKCRVTVNGKEELSCQYRITSDVEVFYKEEKEILSEIGLNETENATQNTCFLLDIGTTTLALCLLSLDKKKPVKVITRNNPQRVFGSDVISRIEYCKNNGVEKPRDILIDAINEMLTLFPSNDAHKLYVAGNTTMLHIFFGINPASIGIAPYTSVFLESRSEKAENINGITEIISLPCISSFIGADITAGLTLAKAPENEKYNLLVDLGTNAEIVLYSKDKIICTSAAAGPCFEGANISCGMSGTEGAIFSYSKGKIQVIDNTTAKGICGTGLIDIIAELLYSGEIDKSGFMAEEEIQLTEDVFITQEDVRQYQLAKSAIFSSIITLLKYEKISFNKIEKMYVSGGFSSEINIENAVTTGLLPRELKDKFTSVNNSSLQGLIKVVSENKDLTKITENAKYIDLSQDEHFSQLFIENMAF